MQQLFINIISLILSLILTGIATFLCFKAKDIVNKALINYGTKEETKQLIEKELLLHEKNCSNNSDLKILIEKIFTEIKEINNKLYNLAVEKEGS